MGRLEIHVGEGGVDAALFASELARAVSKHASVSVKTDGTTQLISCL